MNKKTIQLTQYAVNFAARFGFLTKDIFFEHLCRNRKSQQYQHWKSLTESGLFFPSIRQQGLCYLSHKGKKLAQYQAAPNKSLYVLSHEIIVANILFELESTGLLVDSWTEFELATDPYEACLLLGLKRIDKLPDLLVDLKGRNKTLRIAIEVENTLKSKERYHRIGYSYLNMKNVSLVIYCCSKLSIQRTVRKIFSDSIFFKEQKSPITFLNDDFVSSKLDAEAIIINRKMPIKNMLMAALEIEANQWPQQPKTNRNQFREINPMNLKNENHFSKKDQELEPARPTPAPWQSLRDHPHSTNTLIEGGHEPGAGVGRGPDLTEEEKLKE